MSKVSPKSLIPAERIERKIYLLRGHKVMLDQDLASLYHVPTKALVQAVKRNADRFPATLCSSSPKTNWSVGGHKL